MLKHPDVPLELKQKLVELKDERTRAAEAKRRAEISGGPPPGQMALDLE